VFCQKASLAILVISVKIEINEKDQEKVKLYGWIKSYASYDKFVIRQL
jgi:hypothetical protein